jgi:hypothetical protein
MKPNPKSNKQTISQKHQENVSNVKSQQFRYSTLKSFIPLTCGCGGWANVIEEVEGHIWV